MPAAARRFQAISLELVVPDQLPLFAGGCRRQELLAGLRAGFDLEQALGGFLQVQTDFLAGLAHGAGIVGFTAVEVPRCAGIPRAGEGVFLERAFLEEHFAASVEDQQMHGPVFKPAPMHLAPGLFANDPVPVVYDIKDFFAQAASSLEKAVNNSKLTFSALAALIDMPVPKLQNEVIRQLGKEAAATSTSTSIFTRHMYIAMALVEVLETKFNEDISNYKQNSQV